MFGGGSFSPAVASPTGEQEATQKQNVEVLRQSPATSETSGPVDAAPTDEASKVSPSPETNEKSSEPSKTGRVPADKPSPSVADRETTSEESVGIEEETDANTEDVSGLGRPTPLSLDDNGNNVPKAPTSKTTIIKVSKKDVRTGPAIQGVAHKYATGAKFRLFTNSNNSIGRAVDEPWATCTIQANDDGVCYFEVPGTNTPKGAGNNGKSFWIKELEPVSGSLAAANYTLMTQFRTGSDSGGSAMDYAYRTPNMVANSTISMPSEEVTGTLRQSSGMWANRLKNPQLAARCEAGIKVALLFDLSGSVKNANAAGTLGAAGKGFVEALSGTGSSVALFSFGNLSPRPTTQNYQDLVKIDEGSNRQVLKSNIQGYINSFTASGYESNGTNWDRGMWAMAESPVHYDLAVVLTDGNPTYSGTKPDGPGSSTYFRELEQAVFSANALKDKGTRVMTVGIGAGLSPANLGSISGPTRYGPGATLNSADYFSADWNNLKPLLENYAQSISCQAGLTGPVKLSV